MLIVVSASLVGCHPQDGPELGRVQGTVRYRGKPLENAMVVFMPDRLGIRSASDPTDADGHYDLTTYVPGDGAVVGTHRVTVTKRGPDKPGPKANDFPGLPNFIEGPPLIPEKYFNFDTSGLTAEVTADGVTVDFDLTDE